MWFLSFYRSKCSDLYLERQISSRGSGKNFFIENWLEIVRVMTFFSTLYVFRKMFFWLFHLSKCSETYLDRQISSRGSGRIFLSKIDWKSLELWHFVSNIRDIRNPIGSFHHFFALLGHSQRKIWFCHFFVTLKKRHYFCDFFISINRIFRLGIFTIYQKNMKKHRFLPSTPRRHYFSVFLCFYCIILIGAGLTTKYSIGKNSFFSTFVLFHHVATTSL